MLTQTFCCFDGISASGERRLWSQACLEWRDLLVLEPAALSRGKLARVREQIAQAEVALSAGCLDYFLNRLSNPDKVRVLPHVLEAAGFLDIETSGLGADAEVTTVALVCGGRPRIYIRGRNLDNLLRDLADVRLLVTYNGSSFDLPRLRKAFRIDLAVPHLDLRYVLEALGYRGGLKRCEHQLGVRRDGEALTGADAVVLWESYQAGDEEALETLVRYNLQDAVSLQVLAVKAYNLVMGSHPRPKRLHMPRAIHLDRIGLEEAL